MGPPRPPSGPSCPFLPLWLLLRVGARLLRASGARRAAARAIRASPFLSLPVPARRGEHPAGTRRAPASRGLGPGSRSGSAWWRARTISPPPHASHLPPRASALVRTSPQPAATPCEHRAAAGHRSLTVGGCGTVNGDDRGETAWKQPQLGRWAAPSRAARSSPRGATRPHGWARPLGSPTGDSPLATAASCHSPGRERARGDTRTRCATCAGPVASPLQWHPYFTRALTSRGRAPDSRVRVRLLRVRVRVPDSPFVAQQAAAWPSASVRVLRVNEPSEPGSADRKEAASHFIRSPARPIEQPGGPPQAHTTRSSTANNCLPKRLRRLSPYLHHPPSLSPSPPYPPSPPQQRWLPHLQTYSSYAMDALRSLVQPLVGGGGGSSMIDGMKLVVLGGTVETARRVASSGWYAPPSFNA